MVGLILIYILLVESNAKIVTEEKGLADVINAMSTHPRDAGLVESAAAALLGLSMEGQFCSVI